MKRTTKFTALIVIASMIFCMITPLVNAEEAPSGEENNKFSITIKNSNSTHEFTAYQIFKGRVDKTDGRLSDVDWGKNINHENITTSGIEDKKSFINALKADDILKTRFENIKDARSIAKALEGIENDSKEAIRFAEIVSNYLKEEGTKLVFDNSNNVHKAENLDGGYYLIKDTGTISNNESSTRYILQLNQDQEVNVKAGTTSVEKLVRRAGTEDKFKKAVSAEMGSEVEFQLTGTLPDNYADYSKYYYSFIDTLPKGLDYVDGSVNVKLYNKLTPTEGSSSDEYQEIPIDNFKVEVTEEGQTIKFTINDLKELDKNIAEGQQAPKITKASKIVLTFKAKVTKDAIIGQEGNINKVKLEYSSNPNKDHDGDKTQTTEDEAKVYTYELEIEKKDKDKSTTLQNVGFKIYKKVKENGIEKTLYATSDGSYITGWTENKSDATEFVTQEGGKTNIKGLSSGTYYLTETKFLPRYDSIGDIEIKIEEKFGEDEGTEESPETTKEKEELKSLTFTIKEIKDEDSEDTAEEDKMVESNGTSGDIQTGKFSITIYNKKGSLLPKTGGIGTIIFYVLGISLILFAVYLIISKRKKR